MDLIPAAYREKLRRKRQWRRFALVCAAVLGIAAAARAGIELLTQRAGPVYQRYLQLDAEAQQRRTAISTLQARVESAELRRRMLASLRGESDIAPLFKALDNAYHPSVWLLEMTFQREGALEVLKPGAVNTGYFIVVPKEAAASGAPGTDQAWRTRKHLEIRGLAADHGALTSFMKLLDGQPGFESVRLLQTGTRNYTTTQVVEFSLAATLQPEAK